MPTTPAMDRPRSAALTALLALTALTALLALKMAI
jgi:hypothetical protein